MFENYVKSTMNHNNKHLKVFDYIFKNYVERTINYNITIKIFKKYIKNL